MNGPLYRFMVGLVLQMGTPPKNLENISGRGVLEQVRQIASGGMAHIYKARQPALDRYIVVKKLKEELFTNADAIERFRREARALASVLHQNIAHVYDFVEDGQDSYLLMEYIDGIDLSTVIQKVGQLPPTVAACILLNVARGVSYIHAYHLIHRDIKPSNIRLTSRGEVKLMDFGIVMDIENTSLTRPGMMVGSPSYLSPEQVLGDSITTKADLFLLGITFYEMLTGTRPFKDEGRETVFQRIRETKYIRAREMNPTIPKVLDKMIRRCLKRVPSERYESVKELVAELETFLGAEKSNHTSDVILKYLDNEALLSPSVPFNELEEKNAWWQKLSVKVWLGMGMTLLVGFLIGYFSSHYEDFSFGSHPPLEPSTAKAIKTLKK